MNLETPTIPLLITAKKAAFLLSISERTLSKWTADGIVQARRFGRVLRYSLVEIQRLANGEPKKVGV